LTKKEVSVLTVVLILLLAGLAVKAYRMSHAPEGPVLDIQLKTDATIEL
jgi:hypothetical protein